MLNTPFSPWPSFTEEEADAVRRVVLSNKVNYWTGNECRSFEKEFAAWVGTKYAIALANGTVALDVALRALGIGPGDEVIVTPRSFIASVSCVVNVGATPKFADVEPESGNLSAATIARVLSPSTKAVICVHLAGWPCDLGPIVELAGDRGFYVIEDCAQAHGARYHGKSVGTIGHVGAWSFCQDKIMTTGGEGGMITTDDHEIMRRVWSYKDHGKAWREIFEKVSPRGNGFRWLHESFGTNARMTEMQAAIGRVQLRRMTDWHEARRHNAEEILSTARESPVWRVPEIPECCEHGWYKCYFFVRPEKLAAGWNRDRVVEEINRQGVPCYFGSCPEIYLEKAFDGTGWRPAERFPVARELGETCLMFLVHPTLTNAEVEKTCEVIKQVAEMAS